MPIAHGYGRVSHLDQEEKGESLPAQEQRTRAYFDFKLKDSGVEWGRFFAEPRHVSAYTSPLPERPAGRELISALKDGDHVIFDKIDRMWRSLADFVALREYFERHDIHVHVVNYMGASFEWASPMGRWIVVNMVNNAELESAQMSVRVRDELEKRRAAGRWIRGSSAPFGARVVGKGRNRTLVWNDKDIALMRRIVDMFDVQGISVVKITETLNREVCAAEGREYRDSEFANNRYRRKAVEKYLIRGRWLLPMYPDSDPNKIRWTQGGRKAKHRKNMLTHLE